MNGVANSDRREVHAEIPLSLFNRMQDIGGTKRSHGFFTGTIIAALEEYLPKLERPRTQDLQDGDTWLDQLMEDTTTKKRGKK
jgi:hypothetical protein